jgi:hypothetical protein
MVNPLKCSPSSFQEENAYVYQNVIIRYIGCLIRIQLGNIFRTIHILFPKRFCYKYTDFGFLRNYLSWQSVLLVEESGLPGENHRPVAYHWQTLSHNGVSSTSPPSVGFELTTLEVIGTDCTGSCKSNYHTITTTTSPQHTIITVCRW